MAFLIWVCSSLTPPPVHPVKYQRNLSYARVETLGFTHSSVSPRLTVVTSALQMRLAGNGVKRDGISSGSRGCAQNAWRARGPESVS